ncbi:MAG: hypothetical protein SOT80_02380, partial [Candidatus Pseudoruminococcus sp.]|nr:hypothetical protein [Ruminococcus sp.]MDY2782234.1 hypothetical protein [Candidatus Pseudoruminococcus sp.]
FPEWYRLTIVCLYSWVYFGFFEDIFYSSFFCLLFYHTCPLFYYISTYINHLPDGWIFVPDDSSETRLAGYYYTKSVSPGKSTENPLFTYVKTTYAKLDDVKQYDIIVYAESVQTTDSNGNSYSDYKSAWNDFLK